MHCIAISIKYCNTWELASQLSFIEFCSWSFLFILTELQTLTVTVVVFQVPCVILSLLQELFIIYMPACVTVLFFSLQDVKIILWCVMFDYCATWNIIFFRKVYLVRHPYVSAEITVCVWSYLHAVYQIWQKCTSVSTCSIFPIWQNYVLLMSSIKVANCLWKPNSKGDLIFHILRSHALLLLFFVRISLQPLFTHHSPDPRLEAATKSG